MEDLLIALAERARASNGATAASDEEADPAEDSRPPDDDTGAAAQQGSHMPSAAQLEEGAGCLHTFC